MLLELARWLQEFARFFALFDYITFRAHPQRADRAGAVAVAGPDGDRAAGAAQGRPADPQRWSADALLQGRHADHGRRADPADDHACDAAVGRPAQPLRLGGAGRAGQLRRHRLVRRLDQDRQARSQRAEVAAQVPLQSLFGLAAALFLYYTADVPAATTLYLPLLKNVAMPLGGVLRGARLLLDRRLLQRGQPHRWPRRPGDHADGAGRRGARRVRLCLGQRGVLAIPADSAAFPAPASWPSSARRSPARAWASCGSTPIRRWCSWATSARWRSAPCSARSR